MERDDQQPPDRGTSKLPVPARSFTTPELEAVIRRALELQTGASSAVDDRISDVDIVRIGQELGLEPAAVRRAMAEVRARAPDEHGPLTTLVGPGTIRASRVLRHAAGVTSSLVDRYLREVEFMVPQRRFPERTRYVRERSLAAGVGRFARRFSRSHEPLRFAQLDVAVSPVDEGSCLVEASVGLGAVRGGLAAGVLGSSSGVAAGWAAMVWATPIADPLMLLGVPLVGGAIIGMRAIYGTVSRSAQDRLESFLDRLEHGELS